MSVVVAIDAGTTGVRAFAVDQSGTPVDSAYTEFPQYFPRPGWVEHDPNEIWDAVQQTLAELAGRLDAPVAALGITDQRETVVAWDRRTGEPLHRAIVWQDRRTAPRCEALRDAGHLPTIRDRTGLVLDPYFSATKAAWLLEEGGVARTPDLVLGTVDSWIIWNLTGRTRLVTDTTNASRTLLYDLHRGAWSDDLAELFGVPLSALPEIVESSGRIGVTDTMCPLGPGIPISGVAGDQQAALFGQACFEPGMVKNTYGTGSFVLMNVGTTRPDPVDGLLTTVAWTIDAVTTYALEGAVFVAGAAVQWLRDGLGLIATAADIGPLAAACDDTGGVYLVPAFTGLGSPWWDPHARGTIVGLTRGTERSHLARAVIEAMAFQTRDVVEAMSRAAGRQVAGLRVDGGASAQDLLLQFQADQLNTRVSRAAVRETTALGAAYLAGLAEGVWRDTDEIADAWRATAHFNPNEDRGDHDQRYRQWLRAVERSLDWAPD